MKSQIFIGMGLWVLKVHGIVFFTNDENSLKLPSTVRQGKVGWHRDRI